MKSQAAKFFCENCGAEVPQNAKVCRHCGRFFSSVRCPSCGTTGTNKTFENGCPNCGYAVGNGTKILPPAQKESKASSKARKKLLGALKERNMSFSDSRNTDGQLPAWSFIVIAAVLAALFFISFRHFDVI